MYYTLTMRINSDVIGLPGTYASAFIESSDGSISRSQGWIDKPAPTHENAGEIFHEMLDEFFPKESAPQSEPASTVKRRKKNEQSDS